MAYKIKVAIVIVMLGMFVALAAVAYSSQTGGDADVLAGCYSCPF